ncbi:MAG: hypothetical protein AB2A00_14110 [Myxococcota bacterium]
MRSFPRHCCAALLLLVACANPVREAETALAAGDQLKAFRVARQALQQPDLDAERRKRLGAVMQKSAQDLLQQKDPTSVEEARELYAAMPGDTVERERAAQRLFRVMARSTDEAGLQAAMAELEKEMGDEASVRSNLRALVEETRGKPISVALAKLVTTRWPDGADRWLDLATSQAAVGAWADAQQAVVEAEKRQAQSCATLPERMAAYDKVRRESAYGALELKRCHTFHQLAAAYAAYARQQKDVVTTGKDVPATETRVVPCPASSTALETAWNAETRAVSLAPHGTTWWLDGKTATALAHAVTPGEHEVIFKDGAACRSVRIPVVDGATTVLTGALARLPAAP